MEFVTIIFNNQGFFMFNSGTHNNKPACSSVEWAFDAKTPAGKSMQAVVMLAYSQGKILNVVGEGDCNAWGDRERPSYVYIPKKI